MVRTHVHAGLQFDFEPEGRLYGRFGSQVGQQFGCLRLELSSDARCMCELTCSEIGDLIDVPLDVLLSGG